MRAILILCAAFALAHAEDIKTAFGLTIKDDGTKTIVVRSNNDDVLNANVTEAGTACKIVIVGLRSHAGKPDVDIETIKKGMTKALKKDAFEPTASSKRLDDAKVCGKSFEVYDCDFTVRTGTVRTIILIHLDDDAAVNLTIYNPVDEDFTGALERVIEAGG